MLRKGAVIKLSNEAIENYGEEYKGKEFVVEHVATKYMPATEFFRREVEFTGKYRTLEQD
jgi:hypothetical protein